MTSRRDWQLQQLGITQWSLRRPGELQGEIAIAIPPHVRPVMVANDLPALTDPLVSDFLRALTDVYKRQIISCANANGNSITPIRVAPKSSVPLLRRHR